MALPLITQAEALELARASAMLARSMTIESEALRFVDTLTHLARAYQGGMLEGSPHWKKLVPVTFTSIATLGANSTSPLLECGDANAEWCNLYCPALEAN